VERKPDVLTSGPGAPTNSFAMQMKEELHEDEEPGNSWYAGKRDEIHSYGFEGQLPVQSGYVAVVKHSSMPGAGKTASDKRDVTWDAIKSGIEEALKKSPLGTQLTNVGPFLSVGRVISCPTVSVYTKADGSAMALIADAPQAED
jgi:hypothetical protein